MLQSKLKSFSKRIGRQNGASPSDFLNAAMYLFVAVTSLIFNPQISYLCDKQEKHKSPAKNSPPFGSLWLPSSLI